MGNTMKNCDFPVPSDAGDPHLIIASDYFQEKDNLFFATVCLALYYCKGVTLEDCPEKMYEGMRIEFLGTDVSLEINGGINLSMSLMMIGNHDENYYRKYGAHYDAIGVITYGDQAKDYSIRLHSSHMIDQAFQAMVNFHMDDKKEIWSEIIYPDIPFDGDDIDFEDWEFDPNEIDPYPYDY